MPHSITQAVNALGRPGAEDDPAGAFRLVYEQLRSLARRELLHEHGGCTVHTTVLVHEAVARLMQAPAGGWSSRAHFFSAAACAMRRVLVEDARRRNSARRGRGQRPIALPETASPAGTDPADMLALDDALRDLETQDPGAARLVMFRFFAGLTVPQCARAMGLSERTVKREWVYARAWLYRRMAGCGPADPSP